MRYNIEHDSEETWFLGDVKIALTPREFEMLGRVVLRQLPHELEDETQQREAREVQSWMADIGITLSQIRGDLNLREQA